MTLISEKRETKTFELKDKKLERKHEIQISKEIDTEILDYIKFEKKKYDRL